MPQSAKDVVEDPRNLLSGRDHMRDMTRLQMELLAIEHPLATVARVRGRISPVDARAWAEPNVAVRLEVAQIKDQRPVSRVYTVRRFDPQRNELEIDFVLHPDDSPAMRWLRDARPGQKVWMTGPRAHVLPDFHSPSPIAIFADDTAIPAVYAILSAWPKGRTGKVWIETADPAAFEELPAPAGVECHLLLRQPGVAAGSGGQLAACARQELATGGPWTVWAAGERQDMRDIRALCKQAGHGGRAIMGYWTQGTSSSEIDRQRLAAYAALRDAGKSPEEVSDADLAL